MDMNPDQMGDIWKNLLTPDQIEALQAAPTPPRNEHKRRKGDPPQQTYSSQKLLEHVAQLVLRHEDSLNLVLMEQPFLLHMNLGKGMERAASFHN